MNPSVLFLGFEALLRHIQHRVLNSLKNQNGFATIFSLFMSLVLFSFCSTFIIVSTCNIKSDHVYIETFSRFNHAQITLFNHLGILDDGVIGKAKSSNKSNVSIAWYLLIHKGFSNRNGAHFNELPYSIWSIFIKLK